MTKANNNLYLGSKLKENGGVVVLPPMDVMDSIELVKSQRLRPKVTIIDPWYNKGVGGVRDDYEEFILLILDSAKEISDHVFLWGFPEVVATFVERIPHPLQLNTWLTWYYKNNPSVIRGWRSSQQACLHLSKKGSKMYPENFFNGEQKKKYRENKMRFVPGPPSVIEESLLVGFVGKKEQTGHPAQKPLKLYETLIKMTTKKGDLVFDPMCGSGTAGEVCENLGRRCVLSDISEKYTKLTEKRLDSKRIKANRIL